MTRWIAAASALALLAGPAGAETRPQYGGSVEASLLGAPVSIDPVTAQSHAEVTLVDLVFDPLYRIGPTGVQPHLAAGPPMLDPTRTKATIMLRPGVKFHDGTLLTAQDVVRSLERARKGAARWALAPVSSITVTSLPATTTAPTTTATSGEAIELVMLAPIAELEKLLALPQTSITKGGKPPAAAKVIGSGPFVLDSIERQRNRLRLRAFEEHFNGRPYLEQLTLSWYVTGDAEARKFEDGSAQLSARGSGAFAGAQPKFKAGIVEGPAALLVFVGFGRAHADVTADRSFRRALDYALARDTFKTVTSGERVSPARDPVPREAGGMPLSYAAGNGDVASAQRELATAARRVRALAPARLSQLRLEILVDETRPDDREIAERVQHALYKLGISATIKAEHAATFRQRVASGATDLWIGQIAAPIASAQLWWAAAFAAGNDDWGARQLATGAIDPDAAHRAFTAGLPIVPLMFRAVRLWHRTDVRGLVFDASGRPCFAEMHLFGEPAASRGSP